MNTVLQGVRLNEYELQAITLAILEYVQNAKIYLFGSRCDTDAKGGDIDLLLHSVKIQKSDLAFIKMEIYKRIGERKIDIVISKDLKEIFVNLVLPKSVLIHG